MPIKNLFRIIFIFPLILFSSALVKKHFNETSSVNVLAFDFTPFTYLDSSRVFIDGIDILLLKKISKQLNINPIWTKAYPISAEKLEYAVRKIHIKKSKVSTNARVRHSFAFVCIRSNCRTRTERERTSFAC